MGNGIRLALKEAGGRVGRLRVRYRPLDDSMPANGKVNPVQVAENARNAARDEHAVAYIGELYEGSANSIPVSDEAGVAQVGIADTAVGLTTSEPGATTGEPDKYHPSTKRTFVRIVPRDAVQGAAMVALAVQRACVKLAVADDGTRFGTGLATSLKAAAKAQRLQVVPDEAIGQGRAHYRSQARAAGLQGADCFAFAGAPSQPAVSAYEAYGDALGDADLFGPDRLAEPSFTDPGAGGVPAKLARRIRLTLPTWPPGYPSASRRFSRQYAQAYDERPPPLALYGYEAMRLVLDAIGRSGNGARADVTRELFETKDRKSALGPYSIDENGDTTLADYGIGSIVDGSVKVEGTIRAALAK